MNIEVGEYIRTKKGNIGKVLDITTCTGQKRKKYLIKWNIVKAYYITGTTIVKHSKNIIDLIEVGDFVNGEYVMCVDEAIEKYGDKTIITECNNRYFGSQIIGVVTKEQFNNMEQRV